MCVVKIHAFTSMAALRRDREHYRKPLQNIYGDLLKKIRFRMCKAALSNPLQNQEKISSS